MVEQGMLTYEISKESSKYDNCYWFLKYPQSYTLVITEDEKGESVEILGFIFVTEKVMSQWKSLPQKGDVEQTSEYNT